MIVLSEGQDGESALEDGSPRFRTGCGWFEAVQMVTGFLKKLSPHKMLHRVTH
jgi:hypothetical protein